MKTGVILIHEFPVQSSCNKTFYFFLVLISLSNDFDYSPIFPFSFLSLKNYLTSNATYHLINKVYVYEALCISGNGFPKALGCLYLVGNAGLGLIWHKSMFWRNTKEKDFFLSRKTLMLGSGEDRDLKGWREEKALNPASGKHFWGQG
jgi:hypothetical protein